MTKSGACSKAVKVATQTCAKKTNLLVYEKPKGRPEFKCGSQNPAQPVVCHNVKRIKICTGAELKKMCAPPPCPCPPKAPPKWGLWQCIMLGMKSALALAATYITYDMGIWGDSAETRKIWMAICQAFLPSGLGEDSAADSQYLPSSCEAESELFGGRALTNPSCCDKFPVHGETQIHALEQQWNKVVIKTFSTIAHMPSAFNRMMCKLQGRLDCDPAADDAGEAIDLCAERSKLSEECEYCDEEEEDD